MTDSTLKYYSKDLKGLDKDTSVTNLIAQVIIQEKEMLPYSVFLDKYNETFNEQINDIYKQFKKEDEKFIKSQLKLSDQFSVGSYIKDKKVITADNLSVYSDTDGILISNKFKKNFGVDGYCFISKPIFSLDKNKCFIKIGYNCGGKCGRGKIGIYTRIDGKWLNTSSIDEFVN